MNYYLMTQHSYFKINSSSSLTVKNTHSMNNKNFYYKMMHAYI